ncbi:hypothetical protein T05_4872 [Trichinella murrelli]|uniref:Uncharacterized protein n=1 Tax=Trichinella murrelli TaxID=144512 RepID=A0A0V0UB99_9BILA|nr:hypothetical protein T05_4872 [Trichinella murrelli]
MKQKFIFITIIIHSAQLYRSLNNEKFTEIYKIENLTTSFLQLRNSQLSSGGVKNIVVELCKVNFVLSPRYLFYS